MASWKRLSRFAKCLTFKNRRFVLISLVVWGFTTILVGSYIATWVTNCPKVDVKLSPTLFPLTALASYPGSGNTWLRHLVQEATGIGTGSVYCDLDLMENSFPFECVRNESVILVKTHHFLSYRGLEFKRMVLLLRNPFDTIRAEFNRRYSKGMKHTGFAPLSAVKYWPLFVDRGASLWRRNILDWLTFDGPIHVITYEGLENNMQRELTKLFDFLNVSVSNSALSCAVARSEGIFHRAERQSPFKYNKVLSQIVFNEIKIVSQQLKIPY